MLVIDIETTHFSKDKGHIVEVGIVRLHLGTGERIVVFDSLVREADCFFKDVWGCWFFLNAEITTQEILQSKDFKSQLPRLQKIIDQDPDGVAAYNSAFDFGWSESRGLIFPRKRPDPMKICRQIVKAQDKNGRIKNPNVEEAWAYFFPYDPYKEKHRAADDAMHEAAIIYQLYKLGYYGKS